MALIDIGSRKQLFVDDYLIESTSNTKPVMNPARKVDNNPVLRPEMPWEGNDVRPRHIFFDDREGIFKMLYQGKSTPADGRTARSSSSRPERPAGQLSGRLRRRCPLGAARSEPDRVPGQQAEQHHPNGGPLSRRGYPAEHVPRPAGDRPGEALQGARLDEGHRGPDAGLPVLLAGRLRLDAPPGQPDHRRGAEDRPMGAWRADGLGPDPADVRDPRREQPP